MPKDWQDNPDERAELAHNVYLDVVGNDNATQLALTNAQRSAPESLAVTLGDLHGARPYLRTCLRRMAVGELQELTLRAAAALWGRGALGCAERRVYGTGRATRRRPRRASTVE